MNDNIDLGTGITLPQGLYDGYREFTVVDIAGEQREMAGRAVIHLPEKFFAQLGLPNKGDLEMDVSRWISSGDVAIL